MAETTPPFKLFFGDEENKTESFRISREAPFSRFQEVLASCYPRYKADRDVLQYHDADNIKVSFTNDEEYEKMLVVCRDRSPVKLYIAGRIDKSELTPVYDYGYWGWGWGHPYHYYGWGHPYYHRRLYHSFSNLWLGQGWTPYNLPYWLNGIVDIRDGNYDVDVDRLISALESHSLEGLRTRDVVALNQAKNLLTTTLMIDSGNTNILYNLARVESLLGNGLAAITWLKKAAKAGFDDVKRVQDDDDLKAAKREPEWKEALEAVKSAKPVKRDPKPKSSGGDGRFLFKMGSPPPCDKETIEKAEKKLAAPKEEEKPAPKPASTGFLFSFAAEPEKPKEEEKPAPKPSGFLFSLPGAEAAKPAEKPAEKPIEPAPQAPAVDEGKKKYARQLEVLHGMGFLDDSLLVAFLEKNNGSVDDALSELLG